jgi:periplasmic protein TonB
MFATLFESRAVPQRRTGSSITSVVLHGMIITGAAIATTRDVIVARQPESPMVRVDFSRPASPPPPRQTATTATSDVAPMRPTPIIVVPVAMPVGIPPIDFSAPVTPSDFVSDRGAGPFAQCILECPGLPRRVPGAGDVWNANDVMMRLRGDPVPPRYPESLRRAGVEGDVVVKFVVDTTGLVEMQSVEIVSSTHDAFTVAVRESLARMRFFPSTASERKVKALAVMPFRFTLK